MWEGSRACAERLRRDIGFSLAFRDALVVSSSIMGRWIRFNAGREILTLESIEVGWLKKEAAK